MNQLTKQLLCLAVLVSTVPLYGALNTTTNIVPRSQSFDAARTMVGWDNSTWGINRKADDDRYYTSFNLTFAYDQTFRNNRLTRALFGDDLVCSGCDDDLSIVISGSNVANRGANDWLADYFGLPTTFQSTVTFNPKISNFLLDFSFYAGLDAWNEGLYFRIHGPFVHTKWNLNAQECVGSPTLTAIGQFLVYQNILYPAGYFSNENIPAGSGNSSFLDYANGATPKLGLYNEDENITWQPLCCSRMINSCACDNDAGFVRNGFGELRMILGKNFFSENEDRDCHIGIGVYAAAPTGTRVGHSRYLFEPIVGNGKHWELGAQVTGHHIWWRSEDENRSFGVYLEANITHLFGAHQTRCFDLCSAGSGSRYMLAENFEFFSPDRFFGASGELTLNPSVDSLTLQFNNLYAPVANLTRRDVTSTIGAQGDLAISFAYQTGGFQWDLGYNFWGRSCEKLRISTDCCPVIMGTWALKGNAFVYGFDTTYGGQAVPLAASDSNATIHNGTANTNPLLINLHADNSTLAIDTNNQFLLDAPHDGSPVYTSNPPVLISETDFNMTGTRGISNKLFTHFNYAWDHCNDSKWTPYAGVGAEVEFGGGHSGEDCCPSSCTPYSYPTTPTPCSTLKECCSNVALTQWGVWFKIGASYN